jgi:hypothetical protein
LFEALARNRPFVWAAYQAWKVSATRAEQLERAAELTESLKETDPDLARAWLRVLEEPEWFRAGP